jgi:transcriptional regulator of acetoin/glycerol metabolism
VPVMVGDDLTGPMSEVPDSTARRQNILYELLSQKPMKIRDLERCAIEATLARTGENVTQAMRELGIGRTTLYRKLKKYGRR